MTDTTQPIPGEPLTAETARLLRAGDKVEAVQDFLDHNQRALLTKGRRYVCVQSGFVGLVGVKADDSGRRTFWTPGSFIFVSRPSGDQPLETGVELAADLRRRSEACSQLLMAGVTTADQWRLEGKQQAYRHAAELALATPSAGDQPGAASEGAGERCSADHAVQADSGWAWCPFCRADFTTPSARKALAALTQAAPADDLEEALRPFAEKYERRAASHGDERDAKQIEHRLGDFRLAYEALKSRGRTA